MDVDYLARQRRIPSMYVLTGHQLCSLAVNVRFGLIPTQSPVPQGAVDVPICSWSAGWGTKDMSDLRDWLRGNNLDQYADAFEANDIDLDILPDLDDRDLAQLGLSLGNRRRLLKAIGAHNTAAVTISS
jgi:hypothetical protein